MSSSTTRSRPASILWANSPFAPSSTSPTSAQFPTSATAPKFSSHMVRRRSSVAPNARRYPVDETKTSISSLPSEPTIPESVPATPVKEFKTSPFSNLVNRLSISNASGFAAATLSIPRRFSTTTLNTYQHTAARFPAFGRFTSWLLKKKRHASFFLVGLGIVAFILISTSYGPTGGFTSPVKPGSSYVEDDLGVPVLEHASVHGEAVGGIPQSHMAAHGSHSGHGHGHGHRIPQHEPIPVVGGLGRTKHLNDLELDSDAELATLISFMAALSSNSLPTNLDPSVSIDPQLVVDFDTRAQGGDLELETLVQDTWINYPVVILSKLYSPIGRDIKAIISSLYLYPRPVMWELDDRDDADVIVPLMHRLTNSTDLPVLLIGGQSVGMLPNGKDEDNTPRKCFERIQAMNESGQLAEIITAAGANVNGWVVKKKKKGGH